MSERFKAMRGTHDLLPEEARVWRRLEACFVGLCERYGYQEIRVPIFEATELFERGTGFTTDVVQKEMYTFLDKKGRRLSLRPEATPSVIRAYLEHNLARRGGTTKLFYMGPMFRYDRPGQGRYRQFHQVGVEIIGSASPSADAEAVVVLWEFLRELGLGDIRVRLNTLGCKDCRVRFSQALKEFLKTRLSDLCGDCGDRVARNPLRVLDCKKPGCKAVIERAPGIATILCADCVAHFDNVNALLARASVEAYVDPKLVRGLDYYTRTVFEVFHGATGVEISLGGGGRYDDLVREMGGPSTPAVGFSSGVERVALALGTERAGLAEADRVDVYVAWVGEDAAAAAFDLARELRRCHRVWVELDARRVDRQVAAASRLGAKFTAIIGHDEIAKGVITVKDMASGRQHEVPRDGTAAWLAGRLGGGRLG